MTYPQPSSTKPVKDGQQFFRLNTPIVSSGDIYESEVSANAIVLGPDSDIARVLITYYDPDQTVGLSQAVVSPDRSMTGLVPAVNTEDYISSFTMSNPRKGRVLFTVDDIYDSRYRPATFVVGEDSIVFETPNLDLIAYFKSLPSVVPPRSDRTFVYQYFASPVVGGKSSWLIVPMYGRKSGFITIQNLDGINTVTVRISGVKLQPTSLGGGGWQGGFGAAIPLVSLATTQVKYRSSVDGLWDLLCIELDNYAGAAMPITITLSDDPE